MSRSRVLGAGLGTVALAVSGVGVASSADAATSAVPTDARCSRPLPAPVVGDPGVSAGASSGARVWHDAGGWHVRFTHPGDGTEVFTGTVRSPQPITVHGYRLEKQDSYSIGDHGRTVTFRLVNHGAVDGLDLTDRCAVNTSFDLRRDDHRLPTTDIYLGSQGAHPLGNPFLVQRHR